jgi:hypothetical protein
LIAANRTVIGLTVVGHGVYGLKTRDLFIVSTYISARLFSAELDWVQTTSLGLAWPQYYRIPRKSISTFDAAATDSALQAKHLGGRLQNAAKIWTFSISIFSAQPT